MSSLLRLPITALRSRCLRCCHPIHVDTRGSVTDAFGIFSVLACRVCVTAAHSDEQIHALVKALKAVAAAIIPATI